MTSETMDRGNKRIKSATCLVCGETVEALDNAEAVCSCGGTSIKTRTEKKQR